MYLWVFVLANLASNAIIATECPYSKVLGKILLNTSVSNTSLSAYSLTDLPPTCLSVSSLTRLSLSPLSQLSVSGSGTCSLVMYPKPTHYFALCHGY